MKTAPLLLGLLVAALAVASLPSSQAMQAPPIIVCVTEPCPGPVPPPSACTLENLTPGSNPYSTINPRETVWGTDTGCDIDVATPAMDCAPPSSTGVDRTVGPVHVHGAVCDGGIPDRVCCLIAWSAALPPIDVDTRDWYACAPPSGFVVERTIGKVHVAILVCDGGIGDRLPELEASAMRPPIYCVMAPCPGPYPPPALSWCFAEAATPEPASTLLWGTDAGCDIDVETNWYCIYGEIPVDRTVGPVHVVTRICTPNVPIEPTA